MPVCTVSLWRWRRKTLSERRRAASLAAGLLLLTLLACGSPAVPETVPIPIPTLPLVSVSPTSPTADPPATPTPLVPDSGWQPLAAGLEKRTINLFEPERATPYESVTILRIDPTHYYFEIGYNPGQPQTLREWMVATGATAVVNGGFFTPDWTATGLIIDEGEASGTSYGSFAGMVAVRDGRPSLRWLATQPYDPAEALDGGLQSFPMLVKTGGEQGIPAELENDRPDRRTAIAQDRAGRLLFIIAPRGGLTLHTFSRFLAGSDLGLDLAINLDGGTSSGMLWQEGGELQGVPSFSPLPVVIFIRVQ